MSRRLWAAGLCAGALVLAACSGDDAGSDSTAAVTTTEPPATDAPASTDAPTTVATTPSADSTPPVTDAPPATDVPPATDAPPADQLLVGASSRSILPTVDGTTDYLADAPGWRSPVAPDDIGVYVPAFDQGSVDVGNGGSDAAWVHDDIRSTAIAVQRGEERLVLVSANVYMVFKADADEIVSQARAALPAEWREAPIIVSATHNHHGPDTAFSVNDEWYAHMAEQTVAAITEAVQYVQPAELSVAAGEHRFGVSDGRDPIILDPRLNVLVARSTETGDAIVTVVQWASHPETTLGWDPPARGLERICAEHGWEGEDCTADGRYLTGDYPTVLTDRVREAIGGEVAYFNGAIGNQIGPGDAAVWQEPDGQLAEDGWLAPADAQPVAGCDDLSCENLARTAAIGDQLALGVLALVDRAEPFTADELTVRSQPFYSRLTNIGFRVLLADGSLGWQDPVAYVCDGTELTDDTCRSDEGRLIDDPVLTPLIDGQIREGDVLATQLTHVDLGPVGFLFMPGELPPELVVGLPADFDEDPDRFYREDRTLHAEGADYVIPGYLLDLVDDEVEFTVGLGGDELGYWVPASEARLLCSDITLGGVHTCQELFDAGLLVTPDAVGGLVCQAVERGDPVTDDEGLLAAVANVCRYGQALGQSFGEPDGHYEETNSAGWNLVDDTWAAAVALFGDEGTGRINPDNPGEQPPVG